MTLSLPPPRALAAVLAAALLAAAPPPSAPTPPPSSMPEGAGSGVGHPRRSSFAVGPDVRNPFLPIGWRPETPVAERRARPSIDAGAFRVTTISIGRGRVRSHAIINGMIRAEGESFAVKIGDDEVPVTVNAIRDGHVVLSAGGARIELRLKAP